MNEEWRPVPGFDSYEVSSLGRVKSLGRYVKRMRYGKSYRTWMPEKILKGSAIQSGHLQVVLSPNDGSKPRSLLIHRILLTTFVGPCPDGMEGCHRNGNPADNRLENLRWDTREANQQDSVAHGTHASTKKTHCPQQHPYTPENTLIDRGQRKCRTCSREFCRRNRNRKIHNPEGIPS